jgi:hypothetical protein
LYQWLKYRIFCAKYIRKYRETIKDDESDLIGDEKMLFVYYPKCSTCQKAKKWLDEHNIN